MDLNCAICNKTAPKRCSSCQSVGYCSAEHQKEHWKTHKKDCKYYRIVDDPELGRGLVATRDIKEGTIILDEAPIALSPFWNEPSCISCGSKLLSDKLEHGCPKCSWPVCSLECAKMTIHADNECRLIASKEFGFPPPTLPSEDMHVFMLFIRTYCLKQKHPGIFQQIVDLSSDPSLREFDDDAQKKLDLMMPYLKPLDLALQVDEMKKLLMAVGFKCKDMHDCQETHTLQTAIAVKKGDPLTVAYLRVGIIYGTKCRQESIHASGFQCKCARCLDPTELGTYTSGISCRSCQPTGQDSIGYLLPENPLDLSENARWKCNSCGSTRLACKVLAPVEALGKLVSEQLETNDGNSLFANCKNLVGRYSGKLLHPNHWVIQIAKTAFVNFFYRQDMTYFVDMDAEFRTYFIEWGKDLLTIQEILSPVLSKYRACLQFLVGFALQGQGNSLMAKKSYREAITNFQQCIDLHKESLKFFKSRFHKVDAAPGHVDEIVGNIKGSTRHLKILIENLSGNVFIGTN